MLIRSFERISDDLSKSLISFLSIIFILLAIFFAFYKSGFIALIMIFFSFLSLKISINKFFNIANLARIVHYLLNISLIFYFFYILFTLIFLLEK